MAKYRHEDRVLKRVNASNAEFLNRLNNNDTTSIADWEDTTQRATHKLGSDGKLVYPLVQNINGTLIDFTDPKVNKGQNPWILAKESALANNNYIKFDNARDARYFGENYKQYYPDFFSKFEEDNTLYNGGVLPELVVTGNKPKSKIRNFKNGGYKSIGFTDSVLNIKDGDNTRINENGFIIVQSNNPKKVDSTLMEMNGRKFRVNHGEVMKRTIYGFDILSNSKNIKGLGITPVKLKDLLQKQGVDENDAFDKAYLVQQISKENMYKDRFNKNDRVFDIDPFSTGSRIIKKYNGGGTVVAADSTPTGVVKFNPKSLLTMTALGPAFDGVGNFISSLFNMGANFKNKKELAKLNYNINPAYIQEVKLDRVNNDAEISEINRNVAESKNNIKNNTSNSNVKRSLLKQNSLLEQAMKAKSYDDLNKLNLQQGNTEAQINSEIRAKNAQAYQENALRKLEFDTNKLAAQNNYRNAALGALGNGIQSLIGMGSGILSNMINIGSTLTSSSTPGLQQAGYDILSGNAFNNFWNKLLKRNNNVTDINIDPTKSMGAPIQNNGSLVNNSLFA